MRVTGRRRDGVHTTPTGCPAFTIIVTAEVHMTSQCNKMMQEDERPARDGLPIRCVCVCVRTDTALALPLK